MKTGIRIGDDGTKKNEKFHVSDRTTGTRKQTKNLRKKTKNGSSRKGRHKGGNPRKIYEKKRKMKTIQKDTTKAQMHEKSTKNEKSYRKPARRTRTKNPRKKNEKLCASKDPTPELFFLAGCAEPRCGDFKDKNSKFQGNTSFSVSKGTPGPQIVVSG